MNKASARLLSSGIMRTFSGGLCGSISCLSAKFRDADELICFDNACWEGLNSGWGWI
ncbi:hypothetical protein DL95DRAFT_395937 [Leptodontidium sp. 2 PMI_412]|nr:hypothetical protein DL95DRAFT_395937 [Leptodontidium sp. 2 PMI_412]